MNYLDTLFQKSSRVFKKLFPAQGPLTSRAWSFHSSSTRHSTVHFANLLKNIMLQNWYGSLRTWVQPVITKINPLSNEQGKVSKAGEKMIVVYIIIRRFCSSSPHRLQEACGRKTICTQGFHLCDGGYRQYELAILLPILKVTGKSLKSKDGRLTRQQKWSTALS